MRWHAPVVPATWEAEVGELLEHRGRRLQWAEIAPLHHYTPAWVTGWDLVSKNKLHTHTHRDTHTHTHTYVIDVSIRIESAKWVWRKEMSHRKNQRRPHLNIKWPTLTNSWVRMQNGTVTLENNLAFSYKTKQIIIIQSSNHAPWYLPKRSWKHINTEKPTHIYSSFINNCQNLEATKMSFNRWMAK